MKIDYEQGGYIIPYFSPVIDAHSPKLQGVLPAKTGAALRNFEMKLFWFSSPRAGVAGGPAPSSMTTRVAGAEQATARSASVSSAAGACCGHICSSWTGLSSRGLAAEGPICARRTETWPAIHRRRPHASSWPIPQRCRVRRGRRRRDHATGEPRRACAGVRSRPASTSSSRSRSLPPKPKPQKFLAAAKAAASRDGRTLRSACADLPGPLERRPGGRYRPGSFGKSHVRQHGLDVGHVVPRRRRRAARRLAIYNLKSLTSLLGPVTEVFAADSVAIAPRVVGDASGSRLRTPTRCTWSSATRSGAVSSIVAGQAIQAYRRPAIELYGTAGTANLLGDDWAPGGIEIWQNETGYWKLVEPHRRDLALERRASRARGLV